MREQQSELNKNLWTSLTSRLQNKTTMRASSSSGKQLGILSLSSPVFG
uniref:Uncharacterized protein n=1 Tax=Nelumbo nucifera TaxID=4432 RepID=A0A822Z373_NELNU|nr:TPA_asm: hypothetical protein HUJ06_013560 [Nelumbo nucifera]